MNIQEIFPEIRDAQAYSKHRKYSSALTVYTNILENVSQDSEEYNYILLEYSQCLLESVTFQIEMNYKRLLETKSLMNEEDIESDLENCWECLETCRLSFEDLDNREKLSEVFKGLGDVQCHKNLFEEGKNEYLKAIDCCDDEYTTVEILECVADCFKNMREYDEAIEYYKQISKIYSQLGMNEMEEEYRNLIEGIKAIKSSNKFETVDDSEPINVNHLKR